MKKISLFVIALLVVISSTVATAGPRCNGMGMGPGWGIKPSILSALDLTEKQKEEIKVLGESHRKVVEPLKTSIFHTRAELRLLWVQTELDPAKIRKKQKEALRLEGRLQEEVMEFRLAFLEMLMPKQRSKFLSLELERRTARRWGRGGHFGQGPHPDGMPDLPGCDAR